MLATPPDTTWRESEGHSLLHHITIVCLICKHSSWMTRSDSPTKVPMEDSTAVGNALENASVKPELLITAAGGILLHSPCMSVGGGHAELCAWVNFVRLFCWTRCIYLFRGGSVGVVHSAADVLHRGVNLPLSLLTMCFTLGAHV